MIEINLLPGSQKRKKTAAGLPSFKLPEFDRMLAFIVAAWIIGVGLTAWMYFGVQGDLEDTDVALEQAVADSVRYASLIKTQESLRARQDTIATKLGMIQEIDAGRYIWPHILDEISQALPPFTWLEAIEQRGPGGPNPEFQIDGRAGSVAALTRFMDALEASPFLRNIQLVETEQSETGDNQVVNDFTLTGSFETPPLELVETVPLFEGSLADTTAAVEASNGTGTS